MGHTQSCSSPGLYFLPSSRHPLFLSEERGEGVIVEANGWLKEITVDLAVNMSAEVQDHRMGSLGKDIAPLLPCVWALQRPLVACLLQQLCISLSSH